MRRWICTRCCRGRAGDIKLALEDLTQRAETRFQYVTATGPCWIRLELEMHGVLPFYDRAGLLIQRFSVTQVDQTQ
ncbi:hypothetical protein CKY51_03075 [Xanthomonas maliensis]|nr:hypothetical protein CKY51_03075 [Xanthomonas maliensis]